MPRQVARLASATTRRLPQTWMATPASGIATIDPPPKTSRINPSVPSSSPSRALTKGIIGAQLDVAVPQIRNIALVARRAALTFTSAHRPGQGNPRGAQSA